MTGLVVRMHALILTGNQSDDDVGTPRHTEAASSTENCPSGSLWLVTAGFYKDATADKPVGQFPRTKYPPSTNALLGGNHSVRHGTLGSKMRTARKIHNPSRTFGQENLELLSAVKPQAPCRHARPWLCLPYPVRLQRTAAQMRGHQRSLEQSQLVYALLWEAWLLLPPQIAVISDKQLLDQLVAGALWLVQLFWSARVRSDPTKKDCVKNSKVDASN